MNIRLILERFQTPLLFILALLFWCAAFYPFLSDRIFFDADALAYHEHIKFFTDQLSRGVYPLWDPFMNNGTPVEFFLRRIGSYNPVYFLLIVLSKAGIPFLFAYKIFLTGYYFLGVVGFYLIARSIFRHSLLAWMAGMFLLFSALATRLFDSYINLTFIPMVWLFYFMIRFYATPQKVYALGMTFCLMILVTTYLPFYFLTALVYFLLCFVICYGGRAVQFVKTSWQFITRHKLFSIICVGMVMLSLVPGFLLFQEASRGEFILPIRSVDAPVEHALAVSSERGKEWAVTEDILFSRYFKDLRNYRFTLLYFSPLTYLLFMVGLVAALNRRILLLLLWAGGLFIFASPHATGLYEYLYDRVFFFKFFRNLHFFLWVVIVPVIYLFLTEQFRQLFDRENKEELHKWLSLGLVYAAHAGYTYFVYIQNNALVTTYITIGLSLVFFSVLILGWCARDHFILKFLLLLVLCVQPIEVYHYLAENTFERQPATRLYRYYDNYSRFKLYSQAEQKQAQTYFDKEFSRVQNVLVEQQPETYVATRWNYELFSRLNEFVYDGYVYHRFLVYDHLERAQDMSLSALAKAFVERRNTAYVYTEGDLPALKSKTTSRYPQSLASDSKNWEMIEFGVNHVKLKTMFPEDKFLVYNDSFYRGWRAFVDGKPTPIYRANGAFKGIYLPAGEHDIYFRYGEVWRYVLNYMLLMIFYGTFICLLVLMVRGRLNVLDFRAN